MPWNLVDALSAPTSKFPNASRHLHLPLASIAPDHITTLTATPEQFVAFRDYYDEIPGPSPLSTHVEAKQIVLEVDVQGDGLQDDNGLPHPALRLHAMAKGTISLVPNAAHNSFELHLILSDLVANAAKHVPWFQNWIKANCLPSKIVYENLDAAYLEDHLLRLVASPGGLYGLKLNTAMPSGNTKQSFVTSILHGQKSASFDALPGAFLGKLAAKPAPTSSATNGIHVLRIRVEYGDHSDSNPWPMHPRELCHLFFGNDSEEARQHPLLVSFQKHGENQHNVNPKTRRFLNRPPLRTSKRVEWEANLEITQDRTIASRAWSKAGAIDKTRWFLSKDAKFGQPTAQDGYKCNFFVSDICLRAGFRVPVIKWKGSIGCIDANTFANSVHKANEVNRNAPNETIALRGTSRSLRTTKAAATITWGFSIERWLQSRKTIIGPNESQTKGTIQIDLNNEIEKSGKCYLLAAAKGQAWDKIDDKYVVNCNRRKDQSPLKVGEGQLRFRGIGHVAIILRLNAEPNVRDSTKENVLEEISNQKDVPPQYFHYQGIDQINADVFEASRLEGATLTQSKEGNIVSRSGDPKPGFVKALRIHIVELHPGRDPDTLQGIYDLTPIVSILNVLLTENERAPDVPLHSLVNGVYKETTRCCRDDAIPHEQVRDAREIECAKKR